MKIGLLDVDKGKTFPNLALMKISAYHKGRGDDVEWCIPVTHYDKVYVSKVFGDEYTTYTAYAINADEVVFGGTGFAITVENGKEVYHKDRDPNLPAEIEHIYPDYDLYPELTQNTAYGFLTRGCCNDCSFCIVTQKEGACARKVADLSEFWRGQKYIKLLDANLLACKDRETLLQQLIESGAWVDFTQGLDARFVTPKIALLIKQIKVERVHFAFDFMKNEAAIVKGLKIFQEYCPTRDTKAIVYILTNYDTTFEQDLYRLRRVKECGYLPDVRIYRKPTAPQILKDLQRWCNNRKLYRTCDFMDYIPRPKTDGRTIKQIYFGG